MVVYIAGPMAGVVDCNFPAFHAAASDLRARGFGVRNPAEFNADQHQSRRYYMQRDLPSLLTSDGVVVLPGWEVSVGAQLEVHTAIACELPVLRYPDLVRLSPVFELVGVGELV